MVVRFDSMTDPFRDSGPEIVPMRSSSRDPSISWAEIRPPKYQTFSHQFIATGKETRLSLLLRQGDYNALRFHVENRSGEMYVTDLTVYQDGRLGVSSGTARGQGGGASLGGPMVLDLPGVQGLFEAMPSEVQAEVKQLLAPVRGLRVAQYPWERVPDADRLTAALLRAVGVAVPGPRMNSSP